MAKTQEKSAEPVIIRTSGLWKNFEEETGQKFKNGKTYLIKVKGKCEFMISKDRPQIGIAANEITYKKQNDLILWIKTRI